MCIAKGGFGLHWINQCVSGSSVINYNNNARSVAEDIAIGTISGASSVELTAGAKPFYINKARQDKE
jgi:hypothetical protein